MGKVSIKSGDAKFIRFMGAMSINTEKRSFEKALVITKSVTAETDKKSSGPVSHDVASIVLEIRSLSLA